MINYTPKEIKEMRESMYAELKEEYNKTKEAWEKKDEKFKYNNKFLTDYRIDSDDLRYNNIDECVESLTETMELIKDFEDNNFYIKSQTYKGINVDVSDDYLNEIAFYNTYSILKTENIDAILLNIANIEFRNKISTLMFDKEVHRYAKMVDCKLFEVFMLGNIEWKTLVDMTYVNCEI